MNPVALVIGLIACVAIIVLGLRFVLQPRQATLDFGIPPTVCVA
jgi:thiamine transporter ThiT